MDDSLRNTGCGSKEMEPIPNNKMKYINTAIGLAIMLLFPLLPPAEPITEVGMVLVGVFVGMVFLWSTVDSKWPSLLGLVLVGLSDYATMSEVITGAFGNDIVLVSMLSMILFGAIEYYGCSKCIAQWFMTRPIIEGKPYALLGVLILCSYTLSVLTDPIPSLFVMLAIGEDVLNILKVKRTDRLFAIVIMGMFFGILLGQPVLPFKGAALIVVGAYENMTNTLVSYPQYISFNIIMDVLGMLMFLVFTKFLFKADISKLGELDPEAIEDESALVVNHRQKIIFGAIFAYIVLLLIPGFLPATVPGVSLIGELGVVGVTFLTIIALSIIHADDGKPVLEFNKVAQKSFSWDVFLLIAAAIYIANAISTDVTGINEWLVNILSPLLSGRSEYVFAVLLMIVSLVLTNVANNAGMTLILLPVIIAFSAQEGINPLPYAMLVAVLVFIAMLTPSANPQSGLLHGRKDLISTKDIYRIGFPIVIGTLLLYMSIGYPLAKAIFS